jgi:hypothetical protein
VAETNIKMKKNNFEKEQKLGKFKKINKQNEQEKDKFKTD